MKTYQSTGLLQQGVYVLLACVVSLAVFASSASALTGTGNGQINQCSDCHGVNNVNPATPLVTDSRTPDMRPLDANFRNITTGAFQGNHQTPIPVLQSPATIGTACVIQPKLQVT